MEGSMVLPAPVVERRRSQSSSHRRPKSPGADDATIVTVKGFFLEEIDEQRAIVPLVGYCFMTGFLNAVCFSAIFAWCASQTGNTIQLSIAIGRFLDKEPDHLYRMTDRLALISLLSFILGGFVGRIGERVGYSARIWLVCGTLFQALLTMGAAIALWKSHLPWYAPTGTGPVWTTPLAFLGYGFMSASMGLQGVMAKRINTQFSTSVVLTSIWCELISEPKLFHLRRGVADRDHKLLTILFMLVGGFSGRCTIDQVGPAITLGIAAGLRLVISGSWFLIPKKTERKFDAEDDEGFKK
ncbi:hypothetical protein F5J12DRAFT_723440 [Pisolithus orientalis]|uniref:uncharacterized protein n=1 Tax=Pisolithus orientalis TaxID=936130 RepID=UPI002224D2A0|nr:uncharacterized protein F5J12DRAFT_723440 [Pisolithus orientalis]KAI6001575.1 hypothetical protein F5J12DRAFT_723440 [Pisolithus orientalis]